MQSNQDYMALCQQWYDSLAGQQSLRELDLLLANYMSGIFGYYALEMGALTGRSEFRESSRVAFTTSFGQDIAQHDIVGIPEQLPLQTDNIDLIVASHTLETCTDPHTVLREMDRVLVPEGQLLLIGFNPLSLVRSGSALRRRKDLPGVNRVKDWFSLLGFEVMDMRYLGYRPALSNKKLFRRLRWMETAGKAAWPLFGNLYIIHAKKQVVAMRPDRKVWQAPILLNGGKVALNRTAQRVRRENFSAN